MDVESVGELRDPVVVAAFEGWNDAGDAASGAVDHLVTAWEGTLIGEMDPDPYYDFQVNRPSVTLVDGLTRRIVWPTTRLFVCRPAGAACDVLLLRGLEPNMQWRTFCDELVDAFRDLGVTRVITLGALLSDAPHSRPVGVTGTASDEATMESLGLSRSRYEGPTGIVGVLQDACGRAGFESASFWAQVPHYAAQPPNPKATAALLHRVEEVLDIAVPLGELAEQAAEWERMVEEMVREDTDITDYVRQLEARDAETAEEQPEPSGDDIAQEFERYLRRRSTD